MSLLEVKNLVVEFPGRRGSLRALDDISFSIAPGEILGVVGESGAGKSLTGAAIIGLLEPPGRIGSGQILLQGQRIDQLRESQLRHIRGRRIGAIFQDPLTSLNPLYTVGRQLSETILAHLPVTPAEARQRAIGLLQDTGIPAAAQRIDHYPHQFSPRIPHPAAISPPPPAPRPPPPPPPPPFPRRRAPGGVVGGGGAPRAAVDRGRRADHGAGR